MNRRPPRSTLFPSTTLFRSDEHLLEYRHRFGAFHPFRISKELGGNSGTELALTAEPTTHLTAIADALRVLQQLHRRSEEHTSELQSQSNLVCRLLLEKKKHN